MRTSVGYMTAIALAAAMATSQASAKTLIFSYKGTVTSAENFVDLPNEPIHSAHTGEKFHGSFSLDTSKIEGDEATANVPLKTVNFSLPEEIFSESFEGPGGVVYSNILSGQTAVIGGRPDFGRQLSIDFALKPGDSFDPVQLFGKSGPLTLVDYEPNGFRIEGIASISAPVPEPGIWASMFVGLAGAGGWTRRRRKLAAMQSGVKLA